MMVQEELIQNTLVKSAERQGRRQRIEGMAEFLTGQFCDLQNYNERLVRKLIEKVAVFDDKLCKTEKGDGQNGAVYKKILF
jgi:hypothetical protein